jgi:uncharacterized protein (DUF952 family)
MPIILHMLPTEVWRSLPHGQGITNESLDAEGFIHCTDRHDVLLAVANSFYSDRSGDFTVLSVDTSLLTSPCIWEAAAHPRADVANAAGHDEEPPAPAPAAAEFPHVYGTIDRSAVVGEAAMVRDAAGRFTGYRDTSSA